MASHCDSPHDSHPELLYQILTLGDVAILFPRLAHWEKAPKAQNQLVLRDGLSDDIFILRKNARKVEYSDIILSKQSNILRKFYVTMLTPEHSLL